MKCYIKLLPYKLTDICYKFQDENRRWHFGMQCFPEEKNMKHHYIYDNLEDIQDTNVFKYDISLFNYFVSDMLPLKDHQDLEIEYDFWMSEFKSKNSTFWMCMTAYGAKYNVAVTPFMMRGCDDRYENSYHPVTKGLAHIDTVEHLLNHRGFLTLNVNEDIYRKRAIYIKVEVNEKFDKHFWLPEELTDIKNDNGFNTEEELDKYLAFPNVNEYIHKQNFLKFGICKGE